LHSRGGDFFGGRRAEHGEDNRMHRLIFEFIPYSFASVMMTCVPLNVASCGNWAINRLVPFLPKLLLSFEKSALACCVGQHRARERTTRTALLPAMSLHPTTQSFSKARR
jgi:hypothetical protein